MTSATQCMIEAALASLSADGHAVGFNAVSRAIEAALAASPPAPAAEPVAWMLTYSNGWVDIHKGSECPEAILDEPASKRPLIYGDTAPPPVSVGAEPVRDPDGYAYRYPGVYGNGALIRFSGGEPINGSEPIEAVPYWLGAPPPVEASKHECRARLQDGTWGEWRTCNPREAELLHGAADWQVRPVEASQQHASQRLWQCAFPASECERTQMVVLLEDAEAELSCLTAERDALRTELDSLLQTQWQCVRALSAAKAEAEALKLRDDQWRLSMSAVGQQVGALASAFPDANEHVVKAADALRKDAGRWQWRKDNPTARLVYGKRRDCEEWRVEGCGDIRWHPTADAAVDAAIAAQQGEKP